VVSGFRPPGHQRPVRRITGRTPTAIWGPATKFVRGHPRWAKPRDQTPEIDRLGVSPMEKCRSFVSARRRRGGSGRHSSS
jgi:hypothetical protein